MSQQSRKTKAPQTLSSHGTPSRTALPRSLLTATLPPDPECGNGSNELLWKSTAAPPFDEYHAHVGYWDGMDAEQTIADIERPERIVAVRDTRLLNPLRLRIDGTMRCSCIARGSVFGSSAGFAAEVNAKAGSGFRANCTFRSRNR
jgi:hypothetical protein